MFARPFFEQLFHPREAAPKRGGRLMVHSSPARAMSARTLFVYPHLCTSSDLVPVSTIHLAPVGLIRRRRRRRRPPWPDHPEGKLPAEPASERAYQCKFLLPREKSSSLLAEKAAARMDNRRQQQRIQPTFGVCLMNRQIAHCWRWDSVGSLFNHPSLSIIWEITRNGLPRGGTTILVNWTRKGCESLL